MIESNTYSINAETAERLYLQIEHALDSDFIEAENLARRLVDLVQVLYGPSHMQSSIAQFYLAMALEEQGRLAEAMELRVRARAILLGHEQRCN